MFKEFLLKQMLQRKLKDLPEDKKQKVMQALEKDPGLFMRLAQEIKDEVGKGKSEMEAAMGVMKSHEGVLRDLFS